MRLFLWITIASLVLNMISKALHLAAGRSITIGPVLLAVGLLESAGFLVWAALLLGRSA